MTVSPRYLKSTKSTAYYQESTSILSTVNPVAFKPAFQFGRTSTFVRPQDIYKLSTKAAKVIDKIKSFVDLEEDWNSYGALPIASVAVENAIQYVKELDKAGQDVYFTVPTTESGVLIELKNNLKSVELFFYEDGSSEFMLYKGNDLEKEGEIEKGTQVNELAVWLSLNV